MRIESEEMGKIVRINNLFKSKWRFLLTLLLNLERLDIYHLAKVDEMAVVHAINIHASSGFSGLEVNHKVILIQGNDAA